MFAISFIGLTLLRVFYHLCTLEVIDLYGSVLLYHYGQFTQNHKSLDLEKTSGVIQPDLCPGPRFLLDVPETIIKLSLFQC